VATLDDAELEAFHARHRAELPPERGSLSHLKRQVAQVRQQGFAFTDNLVADGVGGVGMNFEVTPGTYAAISVGAIRARMQDERRAGIARLMREELGASGFAR
jgi:DNA-binding IclR family transcriptional regulator